MEPYFITLFIFIISFIIPIVFILNLRRRQVIKTLFYLQLISFIYWIGVFLGYLFLKGVFETLAVPSGSGPGGSIYMTWRVATPAFLIFLIVELPALKKTRIAPAKPPSRS